MRYIGCPNATSVATAGATYLTEFIYNARGGMPLSQAFIDSPGSTAEQVYALFMSRSAAGVRLTATSGIPLILSAEEV